MHLSTKVYGHEIGLSAAFRQWRAQSHCSFIHGYALSFKFVFAAITLDECNWVMDFGGLKSLRQVLEAWFDHKLLVAMDDPMKDTLDALDVAGLAQVRYMKDVGCEAFSRFAFELADTWLHQEKHSPRVRLVSVEVSEHGANSAIFTPHSFPSGSSNFLTINR